MFPFSPSPLSPSHLPSLPLPVPVPYSSSARQRQAMSVHREDTARDPASALTSRHSGKIRALSLSFGSLTGGGLAAEEGRDGGDEGR